MKQINNNKKQKGFSILAVILVIVAVIVAIGIWALSGQTNTSNNTSGDKVLANSLINDSNSYKATFDSMVINGNDPSKIVFKPNTASTITSPNILDTINGQPLLKVNPKILGSITTGPRGFWIYDKRFNFENLGTDSSAEYTIFIGGLKDSICNAINQSLYGNNSDTPELPFNSDMLFSGATTSNPVTTQYITTSFISPSFLTSATAGCFTISDSPDDAVFFRVLKIN